MAENNLDWKKLLRELQRDGDLEFSPEEEACFLDVEEDILSVVEGLDKALDDLEFRCTSWENCRRLLAAVCTKRLILPESYTISKDNISKKGVKVLGDDREAQGGYGNIWVARYRGRYVAVKSIKTVNKKNVNIDVIHKNFCKEVISWKRLLHPNILPLLGISEYLEPEEAFRFCLVSNWMKNGNVNEFLKKDIRADRLKLIAGVATGLDYLHTTMHIIHGDLKGANVMVSDDFEPCLTDFGLTSIAPVSTAVISAAAGTGYTRGWDAPELATHPEHTKETDIFAFGMVLYEIMTGRSPRHAPVEAEGQRALKRPEENLAPLGLTDDIWGIAEKCWYMNPTERIKVETIKAKLEAESTLQIPPKLSLDEVKNLLATSEVIPGNTVLTQVSHSAVSHASDTDASYASETTASYASDTTVSHIAASHGPTAGPSLNERYPEWKDKLNIVVIGHASSGKSSLLKNLQHAPEYKGKNKEAGDCSTLFLETHDYAITISDTPGERHLSPELMNTVAQADAAIIIASCRPEDEENRQQDMMSQVALAVGYGIRQFIVVVNKMDAAWDNDADFQKLRMEIGARIMMLGRIVVNNLVPCIPVSALEDTNISNWDPSKRSAVSWYKGWTKVTGKGPSDGFTVLDAIKDLEKPRREFDKPLRIPVSGVREHEGGLVVTGRVAAGIMTPGMSMKFAPTSIVAKVEWAEVQGKRVDEGIAGDIVSFFVKTRYSDAHGSVVSQNIRKPAREVNCFVARVEIVKKTAKSDTLNERKNEKEYRAKDLQRLTMNVHTALNVQFATAEILSKRTKEQWEQKLNTPNSVKYSDVFEVKFEPLRPLCVETQRECRSLGRMILHEPLDIPSSQISDRLVVAIGFIDKVEYKYAS